MSARDFGSLKCPECEKSLSLHEYVQVTVERVISGVPTVIGTEMYHLDCWFDMQEGKDGEEEENGG